SVTVNPDGTFLYTPGENFVGKDSFGYWVDDGNGGFSGPTVFVTVNPTNDAPGLTDPRFSTTEDGFLPGTLAPVALAIPGDPPPYEMVGLVPEGLELDAATGSFSYPPPANSNGEVTFQFKVFDGTAYSNVATASIDVMAVNDPALAEDASFEVSEDGTLSG